MARWRLTASHYINVEGTKWEFQDTDRMTGKVRRVQFDVPTLLDIEDPTSWNQNIVRNPRGEILGGDIVVAHADGIHDAKDFIWKGPPTPDMEPMDAEAEAISAKFLEGWKRPPEADGVKYGDILIQRFQEKFDKIGSPTAPVQIEGITEVLAAMTALMRQNQDMMMLLMGKQLGEKQVIDEEPPLEDAEVTEADLAASEAVMKRRA